MYESRLEPVTNAMLLLSEADWAFQMAEGNDNPFAGPFCDLFLSFYKQDTLSSPKQIGPCGNCQNITTASPSLTTLHFGSRSRKQLQGQITHINHQ